MVLKFTLDGKFVMQIGRSAPRTGDADTSQPAKPADIWVDDAADEAYIADGYGNHRVIVFDATSGAFKRLWGAYGKPPAEGIPVLDPTKPSGYDPQAPVSASFANPVHCVKIADDGLVYVCDRINDRIQVFHKDGSFVREFTYLKNTLGAGSTWDVALWPDPAQTYFLTADGTNNQIRIVRRADGAIVGSFGRSGRQAGQFHWVHSIAIDFERQCLCGRGRYRQTGAEIPRRRRRTITIGQDEDAPKGWRSCCSICVRFRSGRSQVGGPDASPLHACLAGLQG